MDPTTAPPPAHNLPDGDRRPAKAGGAPQQFVIFFVEDDAYAVPLAEVKEIIRVPELVRLPLSPPSLEGLANLRGAVLPVVSLRRAFRQAEREHDDGTRVVILDHGRPVGVVVDRMANVVSVDQERIEGAGAVEAAVDGRLLRGVIKDAGSRSMVMILDSVELLRGEFGRLAPASGVGLPGGAAAAAEAPATAQRDGRDDEMQLVSFEAAGQEYALPIEEVQEIVQVPPRITRVPRTIGGVVGVMTLRDQLLPVVSLRALFGLETTEIGEHNRIVVVSLEHGAASVGLVMDRVKEVLRVNRGVIDALPPLLAGERGRQDITSICRLEGGARLVSVLSAKAMFDRVALGEVVQSAGRGETEMGAAGSERAIAGDEEQFVVFRLMQEEYGVPIDAVQEIVRVPDAIAQLPRTPAFIEGVMNLRGAVIPLVDQRSRFGLPGCERNDRQRIVVFTVQGVRTGFIVDSVSEVMRIPRASIGVAPEISEDQRRVIRRVANLPAQSRMILLLEVAEMLDGEEMRELRRQAA
jgi:purine-binding chemotaxis protein CheW